jgi:hypothetical protein
LKLDVARQKENEVTLAEKKSVELNYLSVLANINKNAKKSVPLAE